MEAAGKLKRLRKVLEDPIPDRCDPGSIDSQLDLGELDVPALGSGDAGKSGDGDAGDGFASLDREDVEDRRGSSDSENSLDKLLSDGAGVRARKKELFVDGSQTMEEHLLDRFEDRVARSSESGEDMDRAGKLEGSETSRNSLDELLGDVSSSEVHKRKKMDTNDSEGLTNKKRPKKARKKEIDEMHAESQRLLRETKTVAFEAAPAVEVPMSGILSRLRRRKIQLGWKSATNRDCASAEARSDASEKNETTHFSPDLAAASDSESDADHTDMNKTTESTKEFPVKYSTFRQPLEDTQDLFPDSQHIPDDILAGSQDEEDGGGDRLDLHMTESQDLGDQVAEAFPVRPQVMSLIDDEAEAEDEELMLHHSDEEDADDIEDLEAFDRAAEAPEEPADRSRRSELHRQWLEQQDAAQTDDILCRIQGGSKPAEYTATLLDDEEDVDIQEASRGSSAKVQESASKEPVPFPSFSVDILEDKTQEYHEESDEEETERTALRQRLLETAERQEQFISPADDDSSREVLSIIKKANVCAKKKNPQQETRASICKSKSIFSSRSTSNVSALKQTVYTNTKSFVFGRDDSNSLPGNSVTAAERAVHVSKENAVPMLSKQGGPSLFSILKQQQTDHRRPGERVVMADKISIFAKVSKRTGRRQ